MEEWSGLDTFYTFLSFICFTDSTGAGDADSSDSPYWFTVPDDYEQPISHIVLMIILVISAVVGTAATIYWSMSNCKNSPFFAYKEKKKDKQKQGIVIILQKKTTRPAVSQILDNGKFLWSSFFEYFEAPKLWKGRSGCSLDL